MHQSSYDVDAIKNIQGHKEHKDFIEIFMSNLFLSKNFNLHRLQLTDFETANSFFGFSFATNKQ
jgi:hypothetical protein